MGAMLVGMITGMAAMAFAVTIQIIITVILFIDAYRHNMKAVRWAIAGFMFNFWSLPVYIIVRIKMANPKCKSCGEKLRADQNFCPVCGTAVKKIDDGAIAKKFILYAILASVVICVLGEICTAIVKGLNI